MVASMAATVSLTRASSEPLIIYLSTCCACLPAEGFRLHFMESRYNCGRLSAEGIFLSLVFVHMFLFLFYSACSNLSVRADVLRRFKYALLARTLESESEESKVDEPEPEDQPGRDRARRRTLRRQAADLRVQRRRKEEAADASGSSEDEASDDEVPPAKGHNTVRLYL